MRDCNVTPQLAAEAKRQKLKLAGKTERFGIKSPHFSIYARDRAIDLLADQRGIGVEAATELVNRGGLKITTALDLKIDDEVHRIANEQIARLQADKKEANNASVVVIKQCDRRNPVDGRQRRLLRSQHRRRIQRGHRAAPAGLLVQTDHLS